MKIKIDYVTNSSSASYMLYIESEDDNLESFKDSLSKWIDNWTNYNSKERVARFYNPSDVEQISSNTFLITDWTSMHNDFGDIPKYMHDLIFSMVVEKDFMKQHYGFKGFNFKVDSD